MEGGSRMEEGACGTLTTSKRKHQN